jgi:dolichol kinase
MSNQLLSALIFLGIFGLLMILTQILHKVFAIRSEVTRKFMHISGGLLSLFFFYFFKTHWWVLLLCLIAFLILLITYIKNLLPGIHKTNRVSFGSIFFPIPVYICFLIAINLQNHILFYLPISILTISDTIAEWGGKRWGTYTKSFFNGQKTLAGSLCFAASSFIISLVLFEVMFGLPFIETLSISIAISIIITPVELISLRGVDNLTVPLSTLGLLMLLL